MSKDRLAKLKKEKNENEILNKFPNLEVFSIENAPEKIHLQIKKLYRNFLIKLNSKKEKNIQEKLAYEFLKHIKKNNINPCFIKSYELEKILELPIVELLSKHTKIKIKKDLYFFCTQTIINFFKNFVWNKTGFQNHFPKYFYIMGFLNRNLYFKFLKLETTKSEFGTTYQHFKNIEADGKKYEIHFSKHAVERICERLFKKEVEGDNVDETDLDFVASTSALQILNNNQLQFKAIHNAFAEFITHAHFEFCGFSKNQHLLCCYLPLSFYSESVLRNFKFETEDLSFLKNHKDKNYTLMRHFYFPFIIMENKIICKSTLLAGFSGTPEFFIKNQLLNNNLKNTDFNEDYDEIKNFVRTFYSKESNSSCLFTDEFLKILLIYHLAGKSQFFKGEWTSFPHFAELSKELLAI